MSIKETITEISALPCLRSFGSKPTSDWHLIPEARIPLPQNNKLQLIQMLIDIFWLQVYPITIMPCR
jgi:hypothetical protein